jgi:3-deoxy-manno-octulosonate cytidylyltransferase (CMP-KDO synthetase)
MATTGCDITTLVSEIDDETDADDSNVTKAIVSWDVTKERGKAHYFTRARAPWGEGPLYIHTGIYAYTRAALGRFVGLLPSTLEKREKLEQLRALEAGMTIGVANVDSVPLSVDTPADLEKARALFAKEKV